LAYQYISRLQNALRQHEEWRLGECINLIASENFGSHQSRSMLGSDLANRYTSPDKFFRGTRYIDEVQALAEEVARKVFNARFADVRPLSGHIADMSMLTGLTSKGDRVMSVPPEEGGYPGLTQVGLGKLLELRNVFFPFDHNAVNIDVRETKRSIATEEPKLIVFGSSFIPFPHPVREITNGTKDAVCVYDGSHVLGLIAGGEFQDPLREGCSMLIGSTHKSFPGPQGGLIVSNNEVVFERVTSKMNLTIVDNIHWNRVAALTVTLSEMLQFGKAYATAVIKNSQALGKALDSMGVHVRGASNGYSKSHQVLLDYEKTKLEFIAKRLEEANIIIDNGGRIGVSEVTRLGMNPAEMEQIADLISTIVLGKKPADFVKKKGRSLIKDFKSPKYILQISEGIPAERGREE
jgi:glycine hydroxymethyltransferase